METAMTSDIDSNFAPRMIMQIRRRQARAFRHELYNTIRVGLRGIATLKARLVRALQYHRELELLMHADDRMLADIGLNRYDVVTAAQASRGWRGRRDALQAAATRRDEAIVVARARRAGLAIVDAPSLAPALPHAMETSNFR
jgi:hypothetical protein